ncbi:hypothetical protein KIL84_014407 [Mauremys mutica]|uniref:Uncharacterized protein n=1 Tax=Mauremys mutica TaxID=74926 RepID=A0A9D3XPN6_9SAUR|nr:hypothetical protein KIL84_014407 [Mauremys mutica]
MVTPQAKQEATSRGMGGRVKKRRKKKEDLLIIFKQLSSFQLQKKVQGEKPSNQAITRDESLIVATKTPLSPFLFPLHAHFCNTATKTCSSVTGVDDPSHLASKLL